MKLPIAGGTYVHPKIEVNNQDCVNLFPSPTGPRGRHDADTQQLDGYVLRSVPGERTLPNSVGTRVVLRLGGESEGIKDLFLFFANTIANTNFAIAWKDNLRTTEFADFDLRSSSSLNSANLNDWLTVDEERFVTATNGTQTFIAGGSKGSAVWEGGVLTKITDADFEGAKTVCFLNGYFVFNVPDDSRVFATAINDGTSINALDYTTAEASGDNVMAVIDYNSELWVLGSRTIEVYRIDSNIVSGFPFSKVPGATIERGLSSSYAVHKVDNSALIWLDDTCRVQQASGYKIQEISTPAIVSEIRSYSRVDDCFILSYEEEGHNFIVFQFPTANKTLVYDILTGLWHRRSSGPNHDMWNFRYLYTARHNEVWGVRYTALNNSNSSLVYNFAKLSRAQFTQPSLFGDEAKIYRKRVSSISHNEFKDIMISRLNLKCDVGNPQGDEDDVGEVMLRYSNDGGHSWSFELTESLGHTGDFSKQIGWNRLGQAREWTFEISYSGDSDFTIIDASVDIG